MEPALLVHQQIMSRDTALCSVNIRSNLQPDVCWWDCLSFLHLTVLVFFKKKLQQLQSSARRWNLEHSIEWRLKWSHKLQRKPDSHLSSFTCQFSPGQSRPVLPTDGHGRRPSWRFPGTPESQNENNGTVRAAAELESVRHKAVHLYPEQSRDRVGKLSTWDREHRGEGWGLCCDPCKVKVWRAAFHLWQNNSQLRVEGCHKSSLLRILF